MSKIISRKLNALLPSELESDESTTATLGLREPYAFHQVLDPLANLPDSYSKDMRKKFCIFKFIT
jgi:hypothetical protein